MDIESFLKRWTIRESDTDVIAVGDKLHIVRVGNSPKVKFRCESPNSGTADLWDDVKDCKWSKDGGPAGHLEGTILDSDGNSYPLVFTYAEDSPFDRIHMRVVAMPTSEGGVVAMGGHGGGAGSAGGDDDPR